MDIPNGLHQCGDSGGQRAKAGDERGFFFVKDALSGRLVRLDPCGITHAAAAGNYVKVFSLGQPPRLLHFPLKRLLQALPAGSFLRIHRSCIVHLAHIQWMDGNRLGLTCGATVQLSLRYRKGFMERIGRRVVE